MEHTAEQIPPEGVRTHRMIQRRRHQRRTAQYQWIDARHERAGQSGRQGESGENQTDLPGRQRHYGTKGGPPQESGQRR